MVSTHIDYAQVERSIGFHGAPMQKVWEGERGDSDLARADVKPDFSVYHMRQKNFLFQDRTKRLKLHQFLARKASVLYRKVTKSELRQQQQLALGDEASATAAASAATASQGLVAVTQPFYTYFVEKPDKSAQLQHIYSLLNVGDVVYAMVQNKTANGLFAKILCTREPNFHYLFDLNAKAFLPNIEMVAAGDRKSGFTNSDYIVCEVLEVHPDSEKMVVSMRGMHRNPVLDGLVTYGLATLDQLPMAYKALTYNDRQPYNATLESATEFQNPYCLDHLFAKVGLCSNDLYTNMSGLRGRFPPEEYSTELRQTQASKWAFRSVAEGIEHFKEGRHSEAFQCLNNALSIDPRNVEGLVARGALYANSGSFKKAVGDFETALKLNASHANARKYMGETLVALGRSYEDEHNVEEAKNAYQACLNIIPSHEEAKNSLDFLWSKATKNLIDTNELTLPALNLKIADQKRGDKKDSRLSKKTKKKKSKGRKRDSSSSSSYSSDSSDSSSGSNSSNDSSSSSDSDYSKSKKKRRGGRSDRFAKPKSLSPLSKRMASMASESNVASHSRSLLPNPYGAFEQPYSFNQPDDYELKVRKFLELTREEDNYEEKVRQFVEEANRHRKDRKGGGDEKSESKKRKERKSRKSKKESKKRRKEKRGKSSKKDKDDVDDLDNMEFREALKIFKSLPGLDMSEKLQSVEKSLALHSQGSQHDEDQKWKMMFAKNAAKTPVVAAAAPSTSKFIPKQYAFVNEDDDSDHDARTTSTTKGQRPIGAAAAATKVSLERPKSPVVGAYDRFAKAAAVVGALPQPVRPVQAPKAAIGPVVMDKFGSFRLANVNPLNIPKESAATITASAAAHPATPAAPLELASTQRAKGSRSRSRSRRRYSSDSRSRSRSPNHRSGSRNYRRRSSRSKSYDRSRSRCNSRSRSRSNSVDRRRNSDRRLRGNRGGGNGTYYQPRFNNNNNSGRGNNFNNRGGGGGGYRDNNYYNHNQHSANYRGFNNRGYNNNNRGGRWINRGGAGGGMNNRYRNYDNDYRGRRIDRDSRSRSFNDDDRRRSSSGDGSPRRADGAGGGDVGDSDRRSQSRGAAGSNSGKATGGGGAGAASNAERASSLEQIEEFIEKAKKKEKEEMLDRNADIKKKDVR